VGALDQLRATGRRVPTLLKRARWTVAGAGKRAGGAATRAGKWIRENPRLTVAVVGGALLVCAWIAWAIYVTSENGASAGLGVMIAWPAIVVALALVSLPLIGGYLLVRRLSIDEGNPENPMAAVETADDEAADQDEAQDEVEEESGGEGSDQEGDDDDGDDDAEPEEAAASER
jgi:hypothetical protein